MNNLVKKHDKKFIQVACGIGVLVVVVILLICALCKPKAVPCDVQRGAVKIESNVPSQTLASETHANTFNLVVNTDMHVKSNGDTDVKIQNSSVNHNDCYVTIMEGDNQLYKSSILRPGYMLDTVKLDVGHGKHSCTAIFNILNSDKSVKSTSGVNVIVTRP